jgi:PAS domain S-box-containing protein
LIKILMVDDDPEILKIGKVFLERSDDIRVDIAHSGKEAMCKLEMSSYDAIISDYMMPEMDGIAFLKLVRARDQAIPFIMLTGKGREEIVIDAINNRADYYKVKEGNPKLIFKELLHQIRQAVAHRRDEKRIERLDHMLIAIRNISRLALREKDPKKMLDGICDSLTETLGCHSLWIVIMDESGKFSTVTEAGFGKDFNHIEELLKREKLPVCVKNVFDSQHAFITEDPLPDCSVCPLSSICIERATMALPLALEGKIYGYMILTVPLELVPDEEERVLFEELGRDITFWLHVIELENFKEQSMEKLQQSEKKYRDLVENLQEGIWVIDKDAYTTFVNPRMAKMLGYTFDEMLGKHLFSFMDDRGAQRAKKELDRFTQGIKKHYDFEFIRKDGDRIYTFLEASSIMGERGNYAGAIACIMDITERKKADDALRASEERWNLAIEGGNLGAWDWDMVEDVIVLNDRMAEILDYSPEELERDVSMWMQLVHPEDFLNVNRAMLRHLEGKTPYYQSEHRLRNKNGLWKWVDERGMIVSSDDSGNPTRVCGILEDISERKMIDKKVFNLSQFQKNIIDNANVWLNVLDAQNSVVIWNRAAEEISGYSCEEVIGDGKIWECLYPEEEQRKEIAEKAALMAKGATVEDLETTIRCKNGQNKTISWHYRNLHDGDENKIGLIAIGLDITKQKNAEIALRESEAKYRTLVERANDGIAIVRDDIITYANPRLAKIWKGTVEEIVGKPFDNFIHPDDLPIVTDRHARRIAGKDVEQVYEIKVRCNNGDIAYFELNAGLITFQGMPASLVIIRDIGERKKSAEELQSAHKQLLDIIDFLPDATFVVDLNQKVIAWNKTAERITGILKEDIIGKSADRLSVPIYGIPRPLLIDSIFLGEKAIEDLYENIRKDGDVIFAEKYMGSLYGGRGAHVWIAASPLFNETGEIVGAIESFRDISERIHAKNDLIVRDRLLSAASTATHELLTFSDFDFSINHVLELLGHAAQTDRVYIFENHEDPKTGEHFMCHKFGWHSDKHSITKDNPFFQNISYDQFFPNSYQNLSSEKSMTWTSEEFQKIRPEISAKISHIQSILIVPIFMGDHFWGFLGFGDCHSERIWSDNEISVLSMAAGSIGAAIMRNNTDNELQKYRDELEERVKDRTAELENKNIQMERFNYTISHDLMTHLVTIGGFAGLLRKDIENGSHENIETDLKAIEDSISVMEKQLDDTLELSRIGKVAKLPKDASLEEIVQEALDQSSEKIRSAGIEVSVASDLPIVHVDRFRIIEALVNLIENSIKFLAEETHPRIEVGQRIDGMETVFFIKDNGIGIDPDLQERVFDLFYKIDNDCPGTGAGLAIVRSIVEANNGRIWIESEVGKGCTVCFTMPLAENLAKSG